MQVFQRIRFCGPLTLPPAFNAISLRELDNGPFVRWRESSSASGHSNRGCRGLGAKTQSYCRNANTSIS